MMRRLRALLSRPHGRDGQIEQLIEGAWTDACHGDWAAVERTVHVLQVRHPDALLALVHDVCDRALQARPDFASRTCIVADLAGPDGLAAWLVLARGLDNPRGIRGMLARHTDDQQHGIAVHLLDYAVRQEVAR